MFRIGMSLRILACMLALGFSSCPQAQETTATGNTTGAAGTTATGTSTGTGTTSGTDNGHATGSGRQTTSTTSGQTTSQPTAPPNNNPPPALVVTSLQVMQTGTTQKDQAQDAVTKNCSEGIALALSQPGKDVKANCPAGVNLDRQALVGAGDVLVSVQATGYAAAMASKSQGARQLRVFFNGVDVTDDAELIASTQVRDQTFLQYHLAPGKQSRTLWASLIRNGSLTGKLPLNISFGWDNKGPNSVRSDTFYGDATIAVTNSTHLAIACVVLLALLIVCLHFAWKTSILRNALPASITDLLPKARMLRQNLNMPNIGVQQQTASMQQVDPTYLAPFPAGNLKASEALEAALRAPNKIAPEATGSVIAGLALLDDADPTQALSRRMSFSLARVQLFCWFMFALLAGLFLWSIYTELPDLDNTMLALLGISAGTAGLSWTVDSSQAVTGTLSQGLLFDMSTGINNEYEVHRFQAVLVNLVLLAIGIGHIISSIAYPVFDASWLIFLGISSSTYLAGKELTK